jgi:tight adherence protein B
VLYLGIGFLVTVGVMAAFVLYDQLSHPDRDVVRRRIAEEFFKQTPSTADHVALYKNQGSMSFDLDAETAATAEEKLTSNTARPSLSNRLESLLQSAKLGMTPLRFTMLAAFLGGSTSLATGALLSWLVAAPAGLAVFALSFFAVVLKRNARRDRLLKQLPAAFELMARVLKAGQSLQQAMQAVSDSFEDPLAGEFAQCQQQQQFGLRPEVVFREMAQRSGILELRIFVMSMIIQRQIGGNLAEMLERLAAMIRGRLRLRQQVRTLTAEGRLQGWTLFVLPIIMFGVMMVVNRQYAQVLLDNLWLLAATGASMGLGMLWIQTIVRVEE